ncbi:MAG: hypothetical protein J6113_01255 [Lachnospiraceae bacterium]|nr:hypothetical protein [Lachnospiraceae bacterium]
MEKRIFAGVIMFLLAISLFFGGFRAGAAGTGAGSVSDPLVTKSYLERRLSEVSSSSFVKVNVKKGQTLLVPETGRLFMYSGAGTVGGGQFVDLSTGDVFLKGNIMVKYNIFFAAEGSASISVASDAVFYVLGAYNIQ